MAMTQELHDELIFVGFTNGHQIFYANSIDCQEGTFYGTSENDTCIPLYMLKTHWHRIQTTSGMQVTLEMIKDARKQLKESINPTGEPQCP